MNQGHLIQDLPGNQRYAQLAAVWSLATVLVLIFIKVWAWSASGSVAMLGTLADSLVDAGVSLMMLLAIRLSLKPADREHRYGHGKAEGLAALFQASFLTGSAVFLGLEALNRFSVPQVVSHHMLGIGVCAVSLVLSVVVVVVQNFALRRADSLAVEADKSHYSSDIFLNGCVMAALFIDMQGGPFWVDSAIGLCIAVWFVVTAWRIGGKALDMLMDRELPEEMRLRIKALVRVHPGVLGMHDLRTRRSGMEIHISFDVEVDPDLSLRAAHEITREVEIVLLKEFPNAQILIHKDPHGDIYDSRHKVEGVHR